MKDIRKGFTLIELLVVIAIIALLSSVVMASLSTARMKARDAKRIGDLGQIKLALEMYYDANGNYPSVEGFGYNGVNYEGSTVSGWDGLAVKLSPYIKPLPRDPINNSNNSPLVINSYNYYYGTVGDGNVSANNTSGVTGYDLLARLETPDHELSCGKTVHRYNFGKSICPSTGNAKQGYFAHVSF